MNKEKYKIHNLNLIYIIVISFFAIIANPIQLTPYTFSTYVGRVIGVIIITILPSWILWRLCSKSKKASQITFYIMGTLLLLSQISSMKRNKNLAIENSLKQKIEEFQKERKVVIKQWEESTHNIIKNSNNNLSIISDLGEIERRKTVFENHIYLAFSRKQLFNERTSKLKDKLSNLDQNNPSVQKVIQSSEKEDKDLKVIFNNYTDSHISFSNEMISILDYLKNNNASWTSNNNKLVALDQNFMNEFNIKENNLKNVSKKVDHNTQLLIKYYQQ